MNVKCSSFIQLDLSSVFGHDYNFYYILTHYRCEKRVFVHRCLVGVSFLMPNILLVIVIERFACLEQERYKVINCDYVCISCNIFECAEDMEAFTHLNDSVLDLIKLVRWLVVKKGTSNCFR